MLGLLLISVLIVSLVLIIITVLIFRRKAYVSVTLALSTVVFTSFLYGMEPAFKPILNVPAPYDKVSGFGFSEREYVEKLRDNSFDRMPEENIGDYVQRVADSVHRGTFHCKYNGFELSNFVAFATWLNGLTENDSERIFRKYGVLDFRTFTCGFCHQRAYQLGRILSENGIEANVIGLSGHVVTEVLIDEQKFYLDPDYGISAIKYIDDNTFSSKIDKAYTEISYPMSDNLLSRIRSYYVTQDDNSYYNCRAPL